MQVNVRDIKTEEVSIIATMLGGWTKTESGLWNPPNSNYHCVVAETTAPTRVTFDEGSDACTHLLPAGNIVGFGSLVVIRKLFHPHPVGQIEDIFVDPHVRGFGIGVSIVNELLSRASQLYCRKVQLACNDDNISFYEKLGFHRSENQMRLEL